MLLHEEYLLSLKTIEFSNHIGKEEQRETIYMCFNV